MSPCIYERPGEQQGEDREAVGYLKKKIAVPSFCCFKPPLNFSHVPQGEEKSYQCYDLMAPLYVLTLPPMPV